MPLFTLPDKGQHECILPSGALKGRQIIYICIYRYTQVYILSLDFPRQCSSIDRGDFALANLLFCTAATLNLAVMCQSPSDVLVHYQRRMDKPVSPKESKSGSGTPPRADALGRHQVETSRKFKPQRQEVTFRAENHLEKFILHLEVLDCPDSHS